MRLLFLIATVTCAAQAPDYFARSGGIDLDNPSYSRIGVSHQLAYSAAFLVGSQVADIASSRGQYETNPILGRGDFGARQIAIKGAIVGAALGVEWIVARKRPNMRKALAIGNWVAGTATFSVVAHNEAIR